ncbi:hypothetical protein EDC96DRAFT_578824 [Choanephora cucurbitarum]|nr:hypothetical protein EDC96DRAFT_578824 [Choanephora cucurbitarum]
MDTNPNEPFSILEPSSSRKRKPECYPYFQPNQEDEIMKPSDISHWDASLTPFLPQTENTSFVRHLNDYQMLSLEAGLQMHDLPATNYPIQSWNQTSGHHGSTTPTFFTPGFLASLHEENSSQAWPSNLQNTTIMLPDINPHSTGLLEDSTPSSPIPNATHSTFTSSSTVPLVTSSSSSSSANSSPPTAEEYRFDLKRAAILQYTLDEFKLKHTIHQYLTHQLNQQEKTVLILTSKVAQKSYGTEKRFLCPPPTTVLIGTEWWTPSDTPPSNPNEILTLPDGRHLFPPKLTISLSGETVQSGHIEWSTLSGTTVGQTGQHPTKTAIALHPSDHPSRFRSFADARNQSIDLYHNPTHELLRSGRVVSKHLFINDEKRKRVEAMIRLELANGSQLSLLSKPIKVISKPSKKRQSVKNMDLCIHHGTTVSLFNRIRSQTVSTKYLGVSTESTETCFVARTTSWDPFVIWLVDNEENHQTLLGQQDYLDLPDSLPAPPAMAMKRQQMIPIHYNQHVVLQCLTTGLVSPVMILRKVEKASTVVGGSLIEIVGDPVSQLHKVALQMVTPSHEQPTYLACLNDIVGMFRTTEARRPILEDNKMVEKVVRKRRVSMDPVDDLFSRKSSISSTSSSNTRRSSIQAGCWQEDVSDASVWTMVGTDCITYRFLLPSHSLFQEDIDVSSMILNTPFPSLLNISMKSIHTLNLYGENFSRDLQVWFGDIRAITDYGSRELLSCQIPSHPELIQIKERYHHIPILLVRGDGTVCRTHKTLSF